MNIKEAAEDRYPTSGVVLPLKHERQYQQGEYDDHVTHYLEYWKSQGYAMLKVGGHSEDLLKEMQAIWMNQVYTTSLDCMIQALTIGEERGIRFAEWVSDEGWYFTESANVWSNWSSKESKTTSELWEIAEREGIFNDKNGKK